MRASRMTTIALALLAGGSALQAQGNLSTQGFGYPPGQLSTRAAGTGGAIAEIDAASPVNPAALVNWGGSAVFFQADPEFRTVTSPAGKQRTTTARYPLTTGALSFGPRLNVSLSASTLLDRTWTTTTRSTMVVGADTLAATTIHESAGAINDIRLAAGYAVRPWLRVGLGAHAFTGRNLLTVRSSFGDSSAFTPIGARSTISYGGNAISGGAEVRINRTVSLAGSFRLGGRISAERNDSTLSEADVPTRYGVSAAYLDGRGTMVGIRASHDQWSSLAPLGEGNLTAHDSWDLGVGGQLPGPRFGRNVLILRAGMRRRGLPFAALGEEVRENSFSFGTGTAFANGRVFGDLGVTRASRETSGGGIKENAWTLSLGLAIQP